MQPYQRTQIWGPAAILIFALTVVVYELRHPTPAEKPLPYLDNGFVSAKFVDPVEYESPAGIGARFAMSAPRDLDNSGVLTIKFSFLNDRNGKTEYRTLPVWDSRLKPGDAVSVRRVEMTDSLGIKQFTSVVMRTPPITAEKK